jgi:FMN phosphatase YigB (HAD superfamily)
MENIAIMKKLLLLLLLTSSTIPLRPNSNFDALPASKTGVTVVFDLNGVLLTTDKWHAFKDIGLKLISRYAWQHGIATAEIEHKLPATLYDLLDKVQPEGNDCGAHDHWGNKMPGIMCDWQRGKKNNAEIKLTIDTYFKQNPAWHKGLKSSKQALLLNVMEKMFTPTRLAASMTTIPEGVAFAKKCKQEGHTLIVLSNWDPESFPLIKQKFPEIFELFDAIFVSGELHAMKPEPKMYDKLLARKTVHGEQVIFIDDQPENIVAAQKQGISTILCPAKVSYKHLRAEFKRVLEALPDYIDARLASY